MKNRQIDAFAAQDIQAQVDKVLRGLDYPEPPLDLRHVRELLKLDCQFYSTTDTGWLRESVSKVKVGAKQLAMRPTLMLEVVRQASLRALWVPDKKRILIAEELPVPKRRHAEAHEIAHSITPHHRLFLFGDDRETLRTSCHEKLEAEANFGSGQLLFLRERFLAEACDLPRTLDAIREVAKEFGNTITMTLWRFVEEAHADEPMFGIISSHPRHPPKNFDPQAPCRYFIESPAFRDRFGEAVTEAMGFAAIKRYASRARGGPLGEGDVVFKDSRGERHRFHMETFFNRHEALTLGTYCGLEARRIIVPGIPSSPMSVAAPPTGTSR